MDRKDNQQAIPRTSPCGLVGCEAERDDRPEDVPFGKTNPVVKFERVLGLVFPFFCSTERMADVAYGVAE